MVTGGFMKVLAKPGLKSVTFPTAHASAIDPREATCVEGFESHTVLHSRRQIIK